MKPTPFARARTVMMCAGLTLGLVWALPGVASAPSAAGVRAEVKRAAVAVKPARAERRAALDAAPRQRMQRPAVAAQLQLRPATTLTEPAGAAMPLRAAPAEARPAGVLPVAVAAPAAAVMVAPAAVEMVAPAPAAAEGPRVNPYLVNMPPRGVMLASATPAAWPAATRTDVAPALGMPHLAMFERTILPRIKTVYPTGDKPLVVVSFRCPPELVGIQTPSTIMLHQAVNGGMELLNRSNLLGFNLQQVCT